MPRKFIRILGLGLAVALALPPPARADVAAGWAAYLAGDYVTAVTELGRSRMIDDISSAEDLAANGRAPDEAFLKPRRHVDNSIDKMLMGDR